MGKIVKLTEYLRFELVKKKPKTKEYRITNQKTGDELGIINWYSSWRQYVFEPCIGTKWNYSCLEQVSKFLVEQNKKWRNKT